MVTRAKPVVGPRTMKRLVHSRVCTCRGQSSPSLESQLDAAREKAGHPLSFPSALSLGPRADN